MVYYASVNLMRFKFAQMNVGRAQGGLFSAEGIPILFLQEYTVNGSHGMVIYLIENEKRMHLECKTGL